MLRLFIFILTIVSPLTFLLKRKIQTFLFNKKWKSTWGQNIYNTYDKELSKRFSYYRCLSAKGKERFVKRAYIFNLNTIFYGKKGVVITDEIRIAICGSAIQLTFGHEKFLFDRFKYIFVYPKAFYSKILNSPLKGATYPKGIIAFAWNHFEHGYLHDSDQLNVGLHEMAHTLLLQDADDIFEKYIDDWFDLSRDEFFNVQAGKSSLFREYAGTNKQEFLAVAIECFFEIPTLFKERLPHIYHGLTVLLNQDPENKNGDFAIKTRPLTKW